MYLSPATIGLVALGSVTVTSTVPAACDGAVAEMAVALTTENDVAATEPKWTAVTPLNPAPVMVTEVPPATGPAVGDIEITAGR